MLIRYNDHSTFTNSFNDDTINDVSNNIDNTDPSNIFEQTIDNLIDKLKGVFKDSAYCADMIN